MSRRLRLGVCAAVLVVGLVQTAVAFSRSLIPFSLDGTLVQVGTVGNSQQRLHTITIDGRTYTADNPRVAEIRAGRHLSKDAWSSTVLLDGRKPIRLPIGDETFQFAALTILAVVFASWLTRTGTSRRGSRQADLPPDVDDSADEGSAVT